MKILAIYRHYWPDTTPYARLLRMILERLAEEGHDVSVISAQPSYNNVGVRSSPWNEILGGVNIRRVGLLPERKTWRLARVLNACLFLSRSIAHAIFHRRYDLTIANAQPPVAIGIALRFIRWVTGARYVLHLQDIHPESLAEIGGVKRGQLYQLLKLLDTRSCCQADCIVTLSRDMEESLCSRNEPPGPVTVINNCQLPNYTTGEQEYFPASLHNLHKTQFLFAGNLGRFQALESVVTAARLVRSKDEFSLTMMGTGILRDQLIATSDPNLVHFVDRQPLSIAHAAMAKADYGIVSLSPGVIRYAYPSKTMAYLAAGLPLLLVAEDDSEIARMVRDNDLGVVASSATPEGIRDAFDEAIARRAEWTPERRCEIAGYCSQRFGPEKMLREWSQLIRELQPNAAAVHPPSTTATAA